MTVVTVAVLLAIITQCMAQIDCGSEKVDLCLIIDESFSITLDTFLAALQFLRDLLSGATINPNNVQVSVITYSTRIGRDVRFDDFSSDKAGLLQAIDILDYLARFGSDTAAALTTASDEIFAANVRGERPDARNVVIVMTDGQASNTATELHAAIAKIQNVAEVFAVGIGSGISFTQLQEIASSPQAEHVFEIETPGSLISVREALFTALCPPCPSSCPAYEICDRTRGSCNTIMNECLDSSDNCDTAATCTDTPASFTCICPPLFTGNGTEGNCFPIVDECAENLDNCDADATCTDTPTSFECTCMSPLVGTGTVGNCNPQCGQEAVDLCIIIDESSSVGANNFNIAKQFVVDVVMGATIAADRVQVSVITFSTGANIDINFDDYSNDATGLQNAINGLVYARGGGTNTVAALNLAANTVFIPNRRGERPGARNVVIILTDGMASNAAFLLRLAIGNIQGQAEVFSVGVGSGISLNQLQSIASDPDAEHVYWVATFEMLMSIVDSLFTSVFCP